MEKLEALSSITRLSDRVVRVLGQNPGKFTLQGTNTYLVGLRNPYTLIDTGEGKESYIPVLESALTVTAPPTDPLEPDVSDIIISHRHHDHIGGLSSVLALLRRLWDSRNPSIAFRPPRIHKFPLGDNLVQSIVDSLPSGSYAPSLSGNVLHGLSDNQSFTLSSPDSSPLHIIHTPGHTPDSISMYFASDKAIFTADTVLGQGTAVFEDLSSYISSLQKLRDFRSSSGETYASLYPGHGPVIADGAKTISTYISHRLEREAQIVQVLQGDPPKEDLRSDGEGTCWTIWSLVKTIYAQYPENLWAPAAHGVELHLRKLEKDGRVRFLGGEGKDSQWLLVR